MYTISYYAYNNMNDEKLFILEKCKKLFSNFSLTISTLYFLVYIIFKNILAYYIITYLYRESAKTGYTVLIIKLPILLSTLYIFLNSVFWDMKLYYWIIKLPQTEFENGY